MKNNNFGVPILFLIFNRPETEKRVLEMIRQVRPKTLYVAADGPRVSRVGESKVCDDARKLIKDMVDWPCEVKTLYRDTNLGCKVAVSSAIDWFFENEEMGIILEDDCIPDTSFFRFCEEMLIMYKNKKNILTISGDNFYTNIDNKHSYYFSKYPHVWGWATWRDRWSKYRVEDHNWKLKYDLSGLSFAAYYYWKDIFKKVFSDQINTWDYQLTYLSLSGSYLNIMPTVNLMTNVGFGLDSTHTAVDNFGLVSNSLEFPLKDPGDISVDIKADNWIEKNHYGISVFNLVKFFVSQWLK